jgi:hypothetical protein
MDKICTVKSITDRHSTQVNNAMSSDGDIASDTRGGGLVCVTGGSGFIGSWLVRLLLGRGYPVHSTVQNLGS